MHSLVEIRRRKLWRKHDRARRPVDANGRALTLYYLCYAMQICSLCIYTHKSPSMRLNTHTGIFPSYSGRCKFRKPMSASMQSVGVQSESMHPYAFPCSKRQKKTALHGASQLSNSLASTIGDGQSRLQISTRIHQPPFVFPVLAWRIQTLLPWLIEGFEPRTAKSH